MEHGQLVRNCSLTVSLGVLGGGIKRASIDKLQLHGHQHHLFSAPATVIGQQATRAHTAVADAVSARNDAPNRRHSLREQFSRMSWGAWPGPCSSLRSQTSEASDHVCDLRFVSGAAPDVHCRPSTRDDAGFPAQRLAAGSS